MKLAKRDPETKHRYFTHRPRKSPCQALAKGPPWGSMLADDNPAVVEGRPRFMHKIAKRSPELAGEKVLKSGQNNPKIGAEVRKGRWKGMPVFTLTLPERTTCWRGCAHWKTCYGNHSSLARRWDPGPVLEICLKRELGQLSKEHARTGFVVRLHSLGDFYSLEYVRLWERWLDDFPALRVYGYTAWPPSTPIGAALHRLRETRWNRFAVRLSNGLEHGVKAGGANTLWKEPRSHKTPAGLVCPEQYGLTKTCGDCGLCWAGEAEPAVPNIAFIMH